MRPKGRPKIISLSYTVPEQSATQEEAWQALGYGDKAKHFKRFFTEAEIEKRHFWVPLSRIRDMGWQELTEEYTKGAVKLSRQAIINCLDGRDPSVISSIVFTSCTGFAPGPTVPQHLAKKFNLSHDIHIINLSGHGCAGGYPGLKVACDYVQAIGKPAMVIACELCSCAFFPEKDGVPDPENDYEILRGNAVFADAASAALVGFDDDWRHPEIIDSESHFEPEYINDLGFTWHDGRLRILLSRRVPQLAPLVVKPAVNRLFKRQKLEVSNIDWWIVHAAGNSVLDSIRDTLDIPEEKLKLSRETLQNFGNTSSATVGITGKLLMSQNVQPGQNIMVVSIGPGMFGGCTLCRFGDNNAKS